MNNTFTNSQAAAVLEWRVLYARNLLRLEMLAEVYAAPPLQWCVTNGGEQDEASGLWYFFTKRHEPYHDHNDDDSALHESALSSSSPFEEIEAKVALELAVAQAPGDRRDVDNKVKYIQGMYRRRRRYLGRTDGTWEAAMLQDVSAQEEVSRAASRLNLLGVSDSSASAFKSNGMPLPAPPPPAMPSAKRSQKQLSSRSRELKPQLTFSCATSSVKSLSA